MKLFVHVPEFFPPLKFFYKLVNSEVWVVLDHLPFKARTLQNVCRIKTLTGIQPLRAMVKHPCNKLVCQTMINNIHPWKRMFLSVINKSYKDTKYFDVYIDGLNYFIQGPSMMIETLNIQTTMWIAGLLKARPTLFHTRNLALKKERSKARITKKLCERFCAEPFERKFKHPYYPQLGGAFEKNLSVLDALFNVGAEEIRRLLVDREG